MDPQEKIRNFIETENAFTVMAELRRQGLLSGEEIELATQMTREEWLRFMKEKVGIEDDD